MNCLKSLIHVVMSLSDSNEIRTHNLFSQTDLNSWVFVYKLFDCGFESCCCHLLHLLEMISVSGITKGCNGWVRPSPNNKVSLFETVYFFHFFYLLIYLNKEFNVLMTFIPIAMCFLFISYCQLRNLYKHTL